MSLTPGAREQLHAPMLAEPPCPSRCPSLQHLTWVSFHCASPGTAHLSVSLLGLMFPPNKSQLTHRLIPGVSCSLGKILKGQAPRPAHCFLQCGFLISTVYCSLMVHKHFDLGLGLLFSVLSVEALWVHSFGRGALKHTPLWGNFQGI